MKFNDIACSPNATRICGEALRDYILNCRMKTARDIWGLGLVRRTNRADEFALGCHKSASVNFWLPPDYAPTAIPNCSGEDDGLGCPTIGLSQAQETMFKLYANKKYGMSYCETQCMSAGSDNPLQVMIDTVVGPAMVEENVHALLAQLAGLYAYAEANAPEIVLDLGDECLNECHAVDIECMRECGNYDAILVHKNVHTQMRKAGCLQQKVCCGDSDFEFGSFADGTAIIPIGKSYGDKFMIDDAGCYISYAFNFGAFEYGEGRHAKPFQTFEDPNANNCDGAEFVFYRREYVLRPIGTEFDCTALAADYANQLELSDGERWNITVPLENFRIGFIKSCCVAK